MDQTESSMEAPALHRPPVRLIAIYLINSILKLSWETWQGEVCLDMKNSAMSLNFSIIFLLTLLKSQGVYIGLNEKMKKQDEINPNDLPQFFTCGF